MGGVYLGSLLVGSSVQVRTCVFKTLGQTHEASGVLKVKRCEKGSSGLKQVETDLDGNIKSSGRTGRIRFKGYHDRVGGVSAILVPGEN